MFAFFQTRVYECEKCSKSYNRQSSLVKHELGPPGFNCWTSVAPAFKSWFAVEYSSCFISVINLDVRCFDSLMSRGPSRGPNNLCVYMNHNRVDKKAVIRNRYIRIPYPALNTKRERYS